MRLRPARPGPRPAVLEAGPRELPQRPHLLRPGAAEAGPADLPLLPEPARLPAPRPHREHLGVRPALLAGRQGQQDLRADGGPEHAPLRSAHGGATRGARPRHTAPPVHPRRAAISARHLDRVLLARYAPPGVLINEKMEILQFRGQTGRSSSRRRESRRSTSSRWRARAGLGAARGDRRGQEGDGARRAEGIEVDQDGSAKTCDLGGLPVHGLPDAKEPLFVVLFEEAVPPRRARSRRQDRRRRTTGGRGTPDPEARARAGRDEGVPPVPDRGARPDERRSRLRQRGARLRATKSSRA